MDFFELTHEEITELVLQRFQELCVPLIESLDNTVKTKLVNCLIQ